MAYKMPYKQGSPGKTGHARVAVLKDKNTGKPIKAKVQFDGDEESKIVLLSECSEDVQSYIRSGKFVVKMDDKKTKIYSLSPINGQFRGKIVDFFHQKDKDPAPMTKTGEGDDGQKWSYLYFGADVEITEGEYKGMKPPLFLRYDFGEKEEVIDGKKRKIVMISKNPTKSKHAAFLIEVLDVAGAMEAGPMAYSDNILPKLLQRIRRADKEFSFIVKNGYVETLYTQESFPDDAGDDFDADNLEDDPNED